eukprot:scaffold3165_cov380-Prasinococcus_capsulatus_cf.AAC.11
MANASVIAGFKCAPEMCAVVKMASETVRPHTAATCQMPCCAPVNTCDPRRSLLSPLRAHWLGCHRRSASLPDSAARRAPSYRCAYDTAAVQHDKGGAPRLGYALREEV